MHGAEKRLERSEQAAIGRNQRGRAPGLIAAFGFIALLGLTGGANAEIGGTYGRPAVDPGIPAYVPSTEVSGSLTIAGSDTMHRLIAKLGARFRHQYPDVHFTVEGTGSAAAIREFTLGISLQRRGDKARGSGHNGAGTVSVLASSRPLTDEEVRAFASHHGHEPLGIPVAMDAVTIYVNAQNPIQELTLEQVDAIFGSARKRGFPGDIKTWGQAGLKDGWENQDIHLYGRDKKSGTRQFFIQTVLKEGPFKEDIHEQPGIASEILAISSDPLGVGYAGTGFQTSMVRIVPIAEQAGQPFVAPSQETVANGTYPLGRALYMYVEKAPNEKVDLAILEFLKFVNSREGQETVARAGFFPLTNAMMAKNISLLNGGSVTAGMLLANN